jgi:hypothetical protein
VQVAIFSDGHFFFVAASVIDFLMLTLQNLSLTLFFCFPKNNLSQRIYRKPLLHCCDEGSNESCEDKNLEQES